MTSELERRLSEATLTKAQRAALKELGEPGHYRVNWRPKISRKGYLDLLDRGLIAEAWTWASTTRPDTGITAAGIRALATNPQSEKEPTNGKHPQEMK